MATTVQTDVECKWNSVLESSTTVLELIAKSDVTHCTRDVTNRNKSIRAHFVRKYVRMT